MARQKENGGRKAAQREPKAKRTSKREKMERLEKHDGEFKARMAKDPEQEPKPKEAEPAKEAERTIEAAVIEIFAANVGAIKDEAFDARHASWYRQQLKKGKLTGIKVAIPPRAKPAAAAAAN